MQFTIGLLLGVGAGSVLLAFSRKPEAPWPPWTALALGATAALLFGIGVLGFIDVPFAVIPSLALPFAGLVFGVGRVLMGDRGWQSVLGLVLAAIPGVFWIVFAVAEVVAPHP